MLWMTSCDGLWGSARPARPRAPPPRLCWRLLRLFLRHSGLQSSLDLCGLLQSLSWSLPVGLLLRTAANNLGHAEVVSDSSERPGGLVTVSRGPGRQWELSSASASLSW